jgi:predicted secreted hydrolase
MRLAAALLGLLLFAAAPAFRIAVPGYHWHFPQDDSAHPGFSTEWWYFTGNLHTAVGARYGFELTFFRVSPAPATPLDRQLFFTHFTLTDTAGHRFLLHTRARRGNWQQAGVKTTPTGFQLWNENWQADFDASGPRHLHAAWADMQLDLALIPGPRMLNGDHGFSAKGPAAGQASYYYSYPHIAVQGTVLQHPVTGEAWMDHEFATNQLAPNQQGWDWMGLHLPQGDLMLFNLRLADGARDPHSAGTWRPLHGPQVALTAQEFTLTPLRSWRGYPVAWCVAIPRLGLKFDLQPWLDGQEVRDPAIGVNYWEGAVSVSTGGEGYLELTGYGKRFDLLHQRRTHDGGEAWLALLEHSLPLGQDGRESRNLVPQPYPRGRPLDVRRNQAAHVVSGVNMHARVVCAECLLVSLCPSAKFLRQARRVGDQRRISLRLLQLGEHGADVIEFGTANLEDLLHLGRIAGAASIRVHHGFNAVIHLLEPAAPQADHFGRPGGDAQRPPTRSRHCILEVPGQWKPVRERPLGARHSQNERGRRLAVGVGHRHLPTPRCELRRRQLQ